MRLAYFDCFLGASGETILAALIDAGLSPDALAGELKRIGGEFHGIEARKVAGDCSGTQVSILRPLGAGRAYNTLNGANGATHYSNGAYNNSTNGSAHAANVYSNGHSKDYAGLLESSDLSAEVKSRALFILKMLQGSASLPATNHGASFTNSESDTTTLVLAVVCGLSLMGIDSVVCSPVNVGGGYVHADHGIRPVPAPVTAEILQAGGVTIYGTETNMDIVTPVGAALLAGLASRFGPAPTMRVTATGYAVTETPPRHSLRVTVGESVEPNTEQNPAQPAAAPRENTVILLEANLDDATPQHHEAIIERLIWHGALDVFLVPVYLKLNRQGMILTVVCEPDKIEPLSSVILEETSASSVRTSEVDCIKVRHEGGQVQTRWGPIKVKIGRNQEGKLLHVKPDYEDVKRTALDKDVPVERVYDEARYAWSAQGSDGHQQIGRQRSLPTGG